MSALVGSVSLAGLILAQTDMESCLFFFLTHGQSLFLIEHGTLEITRLSTRSGQCIQKAGIFKSC